MVLFCYIVSSLHNDRNSVHTHVQKTNLHWWLPRFGRCHHLIRHKYSVVNALYWNKARSHLTKVGWHKELKHILKVLAHSNNCYPSSLILYKYETLPLTSSVHDTAAIPIHTSYINQNSKSLFQFVWGKR